MAAVEVEWLESERQAFKKLTEAKAWRLWEDRRLGGHPGKECIDSILDCPYWPPCKTLRDKLLFSKVHWLDVK